MSTPGALIKSHVLIRGSTVPDSSLFFLFNVCLSSTLALMHSISSTDLFNKQRTANSSSSSNSTRNKSRQRIRVLLEEFDASKNAWILLRGTCESTTYIQSLSNQQTPWFVREEVRRVHTNQWPQKYSHIPTKSKEAESSSLGPRRAVFCYHRPYCSAQLN